MPKTYRNLFDSVYEFSRLRRAFYRAARGKHDRIPVMRTHHKLEETLLHISTQLRDGLYQFGPYRSFYVHEPKLRRIESAKFLDRVVHHSLHETLEPIFESKFYEHSYACRTGRGTHAALLTLSRWVKNQESSYYLKCDVKKFFPSIDREILLHIINQSIQDPRLVDCLERLILSAPHTGLPIGNLTSQLFANVYLNSLDQFVKRKLRVKHYIRYMDDTCLFTKTKQDAQDLRETIEEFLWEHLKLEYSPQKVLIGRVKEGISFVGYRILPKGHIRLRSSSLRRMRKKLIQARMKDLRDVPSKMGTLHIYNTLSSYKGLLEYCNHGNSIWKTLTENSFGSIEPEEGL